MVHQAAPFRSAQCGLECQQGDAAQFNNQKKKKTRTKLVTPTQMKDFKPAGSALVWVIQHRLQLSEVLVKILPPTFTRLTKEFQNGPN